MMESSHPEDPKEQPGETLATGSSGEPPAPVEPGDTKKPQKSAAREWIETIVFALVIALLIRTFVVQVYLVEGESMEPTLHTAERLLVNKLIYRFRDPAPGEVVVLQDPGNQQRELIKRIVAVAGETVEVKKGIVYINSRATNEPYKNRLFTSYADSEKVTVQAGYVYVMGDNRGRSLDSRMIGQIPLAKVDGKAFFLFWPLSEFRVSNLEYPRTFANAEQ